MSLQIKSYLKTRSFISSFAVYILGKDYIFESRLLLHFSKSYHRFAQRCKVTLKPCPCNKTLHCVRRRWENKWENISWILLLWIYLVALQIVPLNSISKFIQSELTTYNLDRALEIQVFTIFILSSLNFILSFRTCFC